METDTTSELDETPDKKKQAAPPRLRFSQSKTTPIVKRASKALKKMTLIISRTSIFSIIILTLAMLVRNVAADLASPAIDHPAMGSIIENELKWAAHAIENYNRKNNKLPFRPSIREIHVHSDDWYHASKSHLENNHIVVDPGSPSPQKNLRG